MAARKLDKSAWKAYFDAISRHLGSRLSEIEVASLDLGDQVEAEWIPLQGITYDPKDDLIEVVMEEIDHMIRNPVEIYVEEGMEGLHSVEVVDADGSRQIIRLKAPLALPEAV